MFDVKIMGERIKKLRGKQSQDECAKALGISRGALSFYENGERKPDADVIYVMAKHFDVSADYILGLSSEPSAKIEAQAISNLTGLSQKAIDNISGFNLNYKNALNLLIENDHFCLFISAISCMVELSNIGDKEFVKSAYESGYGDIKFCVFDEGSKYGFIEKYINDNILLKQFLASQTLTKIQEELITNKSLTINALFDKLPNNKSIKDLYCDICSKEFSEASTNHHKIVLESIREFEKESGQKILFDDTDVEEVNKNAQHSPKEE